MKDYNLGYKFLNYGRLHFDKPWPNYINEQKLTEKHFDQLLFILQNAELELIDDELCANEEAIPMHAWRSLGQLKKVEAIDTLLKVLIDEKNQDAFWFAIEFPKIIKLIGIQSLDKLQSFLNGDDISWYYKYVVVESIILLAKDEDNYNPDILNIVIDILKNYMSLDYSYISNILKVFPTSESLKIKELALELLRNNKIDFEVISEEELERFLE